MNESSSSPLTEEIQTESLFYMTDIAIERTDPLSDYRTSLDLAELWIFVDPDSDEGVCCALSKVSPRRWEMAGAVELVGVIKCTVKSESGEEVGSVQLDCREARAQTQPEHGHSQEVETSDAQVKLTLLWEIVEVHPECRLTEEDLDDLNEYGVSCSIQFESSGDLADITEAISVLQKVVQLTPEGHAELPCRLNNIGNAFLYRFERTGYHPDVTEAISALQKAVQLTPEGRADQPSWLSNLGNCFMRRFEHTGDPRDISDAISVQRRAVQLTPDGDPDLPAWLNNLGTSLWRHFEHTDDLAGIAEAIAIQRRAVQLTPVGDEELPCMLNNLGTSLWSRFERTGDLPDVSEAIPFLQEAVKLTPESHADLPSRLSNLGNSFWSRFNRAGDLGDIAEGILAQQRAVLLTPDDHPEFASWLGNLGNMFFSRFERTSDLSDIAEAISAHQRAVQLTPQGHRDLPLWLSNLGHSLMGRFEHASDIRDISEAISLLQKAVELTSEGNVYLPCYLDNLGNAFMLRFEQAGDPSDITQAISAQQRAILLTPEGYAELPCMLNNLGASLLSRFESSGDLRDIAEAMSTQQRAVLLAPEGHASLPLWLRNLGNALYRRSILTHSRGDFDACIASFTAAATCNFGPPRTRLVAAIQWVRLLYNHSPLSNDILPAFDTAVGLLAMTAGLEQTVRRRYTELQDFSDLALLAASVACSREHPDKALEWLEQGRCLVWSQLNSLRTPLDELRIRNSELAQSIMGVSKALDSAGSSQGQSRIDMSLSEKITVEDAARMHLDLAKRWGDLLTQVRSISGFEDFLKPPTCTTLLAHLPESGPIVVVNVHKDRCDAIALLAGRGGPLHIPLTKFSSNKANDYHEKLHTRLHGYGLRMRGEEDPQADALERTIGPYRKKAGGSEDIVHSVLRGLWNEVVKPILDALGFSKADPALKVLPRIWWCPTGALSFLPIHAAGIYGSRDSETIMDYAVSSYTPTITALTDRVKNARPPDPSVSGLFITSQPNAPNASPIPGTTKEVRSIHAAGAANGVRVLKLEGDEVSAEECLMHMESYSSIHLACHASQNAAEPLQSRFRFHKGLLDLSTIMEKNLQTADLAFLSACQTSTGEEKLSDEAVHLAAGMLAAGFRRVVATMWAIGDRHASDVADDFYQYLWSGREDGIGGGFDGSLSAYALHHAIQQLRQRLDNSEESLLAWVPYVHFGY